MPNNETVAPVVLGLGRGLIVNESAGGGVTEYFPTEETKRRAKEMGRYYLANSDTGMRLVVSGGFQEVA